METLNTMVVMIIIMIQYRRFETLMETYRFCFPTSMKYSGKFSDFNCGIIVKRIQGFHDTYVIYIIEQTETWFLLNFNFRARLGIVEKRSSAQQLM